MNQMDTGKELVELGERVGLAKPQVEGALNRIMLSLGSVMSEADGTLDPGGGRLLSGLGKNLSDNPMLVAWGLKVAASVSETVWKKFTDNFLLGMVYERKAAVEGLKKELGYHPPVTIVINPTMRCGLRCTGCYAYSYDRRSDMNRDLLQKVIGEARQLGVHFITVTGGEPFLYQDLEKVFETFSDLIFMVYTNAQHIDEDRARRLAALGNVWPAISVEGYEAETNRRRGPGVYQKLTAAMESLRRHGVLFGISVVPTRDNTDLLASDAFLDHYLEKGALFGWMFTYLPVGRNPDPSLMATPAQRDLVRRQSLHWRRTKPFFMADFWNDGPLCGGCMSGSRFAFITNDGWAQPCTFVHFATHNVQSHSLREIFDSQFFRTIRDRQPYSPNLLRPCKIIDHPQVLREVVAACQARPTCAGADSILTDPVLCDHLDRYSQEYAALADRAWACQDYCSGHSVQVPFFGRVDLYQIYGRRMENAHQQETAEPSAARRLRART